MKNTVSDNYRLVPIEAARRLSNKALYTYVVMLFKSDFNTYHSAVNQDTVAAITGRCQRTVGNHVEKMEQAELVKVTRTQLERERKKDYYDFARPAKDFIICDHSLIDMELEGLTQEQQSDLKGFLLMVKCMCVNNCNFTYYSYKQMASKLGIGETVIKKLMRQLIEHGLVERLTHRTGYRILGPWFDKGNTYQFPKGTMQLYKDVYNDILAFCHERGMECPPYDKHYVGIIAAQYCVETKTLMDGTLPEDFVEANRVLFQLRKRLPHMTEAPQSLAYFEKVLTNKQVPKPVNETHTFVL